MQLMYQFQKPNLMLYARSPLIACTQQQHLFSSSLLNRTTVCQFLNSRLLKIILIILKSFNFKPQFFFPELVGAWTDFGLLQSLKPILTIMDNGKPSEVAKFRSSEFCETLQSSFFFCISCDCCQKLRKRLKSKAYFQF